MNSLDRLKQQFQKTASSLTNFHKTATNLEKQAYFQGQFDILTSILQIQSMNILIEWAKKKRDEVLQTLEKNSLLFKISKHPLIMSEPTAQKMKTTFLEEPQPQTYYQFLQPQQQQQQYNSLLNFEEENCNYNNFGQNQSDNRKRRKDQFYYQ